ncbi:AMP-binding enzyme, partial [Mycobacterium senriense]
RTGERACAVIVPAGAATPDVASLLAVLVSKGVAKFKAPEQVVLWDALPKNDAGKILKHQIRASLMRGDRERGEAGRGGSPRGD